MVQMELFDSLAKFRGVNVCELFNFCIGDRDIVMCVIMSFIYGFDRKGSIVDLLKRRLGRRRLE